MPILSLSTTTTKTTWYTWTKTRSEQQQKEENQNRIARKIISRRYWRQRRARKQTEHRTTLTSRNEVDWMFGPSSFYASSINNKNKAKSITTTASSQSNMFIMITKRSTIQNNLYEINNQTLCRKSWMGLLSFRAYWMNSIKLARFLHLLRIHFFFVLSFFSLCWKANTSLHGIQLFICLQMNERLHNYTLRRNAQIKMSQQHRQRRRRRQRIIKTKPNHAHTLTLCLSSLDLCARALWYALLEEPFEFSPCEKFNSKIYGLFRVVLIVVVFLFFFFYRSMSMVRCSSKAAHMPSNQSTLLYLI